MFIIYIKYEQIPEIYPDWMYDVVSSRLTNPPLNKPQQLLKPLKIGDKILRTVPNEAHSEKKSCRNAGLFCF